ncbi:hypothetical protein ZIOFF_026249 [Zingiber officinale]|uniref:U3 snoRNP-associated protein-like EMB2271 n=1 Tax=Zingiber officinale TaxID=94328 RepID=A0A8J5H3S7_ZINOF|nr:hypothetical protein ZIOFF_026249 [Zingiber officinale]
MPPRSRKRVVGGPKAVKKKARSSDNAFFEPEPKRSRRGGGLDDDIESLESDEEMSEQDSEDEEEETAGEKRIRVAREHLDKVRAIAMRVHEDEGEEEEGDEGRYEREGKRDSLVAELLQKEQLEGSGRLQRVIATRVLRPEPDDKFRMLVKHHLSVTAVALAEGDSKGFSASKDGVIMHWDVETGKSEKYLWPSEDVLLSHQAKPPQNSAKKRSKNVLALAISSDGRLLASGGLDRHIHLWDTRTRGHVKAFHGHRGPVSCLTFREGTPQLFSGSFDRTIKLWNAEDKTHMDNLFGHQSDILAIDCLRRERLLTVGRDRTMRLWKVPEESQLVFRAPASSLECCCFINDSEFLSGSDDGSIELWSLKRKKPTHLIKNAHAPSLLNCSHSYEENGTTTCNGGDIDNGCKKKESHSSAHSWISSVAVCRGSDLAASGAANGVVRLWSIQSESSGIRPLYDSSLVFFKLMFSLKYLITLSFHNELSFFLQQFLFTALFFYLLGSLSRLIHANIDMQAGFVNSLVFAKSARFLVAGVGQEPRLGRWGRVSSARNGVAIHPIKLKDEHLSIA